MKEGIIGKKLESLLWSDDDSKKNKICVSGIPGSGKTTIARMLADELGAIYMGEFLDDLPGFVLDAREDSSVEQQISAQEWILSQYKKKAEKVRQMPAEVAVVQDRGVVDCLAYSAVYKLEVLETIRRECESFDWPRMFYLVLVADDKNTKTRMLMREGFDEGFFDANWQGYIQKLRDKFIEIAQEVGVGVVDTSNKPPEQVLKETLSLI